MKIYPILKFLAFGGFWLLQDIFILWCRRETIMTILPNGGMMGIHWHLKRWEQYDQLKKKLRIEKLVNHKLCHIYKLFLTRRFF
jgi:hypothetical protein